MFEIIHVSLLLSQLAQQTFQIFQKLLKVSCVKGQICPCGTRQEVHVTNHVVYSPAAVHLDRPWSPDGRREEEGREGQVLILALHQEMDVKLWSAGQV